MPRNYGKIKVEVWESGSDFRLLSAEEQWAYQMLISQSGISMVGLLPYAPRKWSKLAADLTSERVEELVARLEERWYVIVDRETEELLVRSFVKHDEPWRVGNLLTAARRQFRAVESEPIRDYLRERHPWLADQSEREAIEAHERQASEWPSERTSQLPFEQASVTGVRTGDSHADEASPAPTPAPSKGRGVGAEALRATHRQEAALRAEDVEDEGHGQLATRAECPVCGPLHDVGPGFDIRDHIANVHGRDPDELLEPLIGRDVA